MRVSTIIPMCALTLFVFAACTQTAPLSITLRDPQTNSVQKCSAREGMAKDVTALSDAVEMCARQLEARGFVRVND